MKLSLTTQRGDFYSLDLDPSMEIENVKALVEAESSIPVQAQTLLHNGQPLTNPKKTLADYNVCEHDIILVVAATTTATNSGGGGGGAAVSGLGGNQFRLPASSQQQDRIEQLRQQILANPQIQRQMEQQNPALLAAAQSSDPSEFRRLLEQITAQQRQQQMVQMREMERLHADPFDVESQRKIADMIRLERVQENMEAAMEHNPEAFGRVIMLYIDCEVNGHHVKAFVDSGAQATILSPECAEACGLMDLLDTRFAGTAIGVGTAKILGRIHAATMKLGRDPNPSRNLFLQCSFTVMEGKGVDLLFGLDMLKRFQACIDLNKNVLRIGEFEAAFLAEKDLPDKAKQSDISAGETSSSSQTGSSAATAGTKPAVSTTTAATSNATTTTSNASFSTAAAVAPVSPSRPVASRPAAAATFSDEDIGKLTLLGASREHAIRLLKMANGNVDMAASLLFE